MTDCIHSRRMVIVMQGYHRSVFQRGSQLCYLPIVWVVSFVDDPVFININFLSYSLSDWCQGGIRYFNNILHYIADGDIQHFSNVLCYIADSQHVWKLSLTYIHLLQCVQYRTNMSGMCEMVVSVYLLPLFSKATCDQPTLVDITA